MKKYRALPWFLVPLFGKSRYVTIRPFAIFWPYKFGKDFNPDLIPVYLKAHEGYHWDNQGRTRFYLFKYIFSRTFRRIEEEKAAAKGIEADPSYRESEEKYMADDLTGGAYLWAADDEEQVIRDIEEDIKEDQQQ